jgi:hypothetical protein
MKSKTTPIIMRINPNRRTSNERLIIINIDVTIPRKGNTGNLPMAIGTLNPSFTGFLYLKYINEALITINTAKIVKFVRFFLNRQEIKTT